MEGQDRKIIMHPGLIEKDGDACQKEEISHEDSQRLIAGMKIERNEIYRHTAELERKIPEVVGTSMDCQQYLLEQFGEYEKQRQIYEVFP